MIKPVSVFSALGLVTGFIIGIVITNHTAFDANYKFKLPDNARGLYKDGCVTITGPSGYGEATSCIPPHWRNAPKVQ